MDLVLDHKILVHESCGAKQAFWMMNHEREANQGRADDDMREALRMNIIPSEDRKRIDLLKEEALTTTDSKERTEKVPTY